jgi:hypothetical protein
MANGLTAEAAAARIGISARSLFNWQKQHPEFLQAIQEGRQRSQLWWEERALAMANCEAGNTQIVMLGLRNRSRAATGWNNDTVKLEHSGPEGGPLQVEPTHKIDIAALSHEQRDQLREILLAAKALGIKASLRKPTSHNEHLQVTPAATPLRSLNAAGA